MRPSKVKVRKTEIDKTKQAPNIDVSHLKKLLLASNAGANEEYDVQVSEDFEHEFEESKKQ